MPNPKQFAEFCRGNGKNVFVIAELSKRQKAILQTSAEVIYLSKATLEKQNKHTLNQTIYLRLEDFLGTAEWHKGVKDKHHTIIGHDDGQLMVAILKVTKDAKEVYLQSYRRTDDRQVQSWRKRMQR